MKEEIEDKNIQWLSQSCIARLQPRWESKLRSSHVLSTVSHLNIGTNFIYLRPRKCWEKFHQHQVKSEVYDVALGTQSNCVSSCKIHYSFNLSSLELEDTAENIHWRTVIWSYYGPEIVLGPRDTKMSKTWSMAPNNITMLIICTTSNT